MSLERCVKGLRRAWEVRAAVARYSGWPNITGRGGAGCPAWKRFEAAADCGQVGRWYAALAEAGQRGGGHGGGGGGGFWPWFQDAT